MLDASPSSKAYPYHIRYVSSLEYNPVTNDPFIAMPPPHSNLRLTPPRLEDAKHIIAAMNDLRIVMNFGGPPYPYLQEHCDAWLGDRLAEYQTALASLRRVDEDIGYLDIFPFGFIREVASDGTEHFVGHIELDRVGEGAFRDISDPEARMARAKANNTLPTGDPDIVWAIGDYLIPSHQKRGIMTAVVKTLIERWAVPHMNARKFQAIAFPHNTPSHKVFLRNGFKLAATVAGAVQFPESKGGHLLDTCYFRREVFDSEGAI